MHPASGQGLRPRSATIAEQVSRSEPDELASNVAPTQVRRHSKWLGVAAIIAVAVGAGTINQELGVNQTAHYALIRALGDGTTRIDAYASNTGVDKARYRGHWYSLRAPGLAFVSLPAYATLRAAGVDDVTRVGIGGKTNDEMV